MWSTYPLLTAKGMATGFAIKPRGSSSGQVITIVTSNHLLKTIDASGLFIEVKAADAGDSGGATFLQLQPKHGKKPLYARNAERDVAALNLQLPAEIAHAVKIPAFLEEKNLGGETPRPGTEVFYLGFPEVMPGTSGAFPILRSGRVASFSRGREDTEPYFLIDGDVYPGDSGGPVFTVDWRGQPVLVGLLLRRVALKESDFSHLAMAVEIGPIRDTLRMLAAQPAQKTGAGATAGSARQH